MSDEEQPLEARDRCPKCGGQVMQESEDPLEEHCLELHCGYYRAVSSGSGVIRE